MRLPVEHEHRCVQPTSASHCFDHEYPTPRALPASLRDSRLAPDCGLAPTAKRPVNPALHGARFASASTARFSRGVLRCSARPVRAEPLTPLSLPDGREGFHPRCRSDLPRPLRDSSVKIEPRSRPKVSFIDEGHSHTCVSRYRFRVLRSRDGFPPRPRSSASFRSRLLA